MLYVPVPKTKNLLVGAVVPIPTLPSSLTNNRLVGVELVTLRAEVASVAPEPWTTRREPKDVLLMPTLPVAAIVIRSPVTPAFVVKNCRFPVLSAPPRELSILATKLV